MRVTLRNSTPGTSELQHLEIEAIASPDSEGIDSVLLSYLELVSMESMEASFRSRLDRTFGLLNGARSDGETYLWNVKGRAALKNKGLSHGESDSDDEGVSGCVYFLKSQNENFCEDKGDRANASLSGVDDLEELISGGEDEDVEEQMRVVKKKGARGYHETESFNRAIEERGRAGPLERLRQEVEDVDYEVREAREMVGMDDTLDFEDEEDEYDKIAVGTDSTDGRLFASLVRDFLADCQQLNPLPTSFFEMRQGSRDRRADHKAALVRLIEDDLEAATRAAEEISQATEEFKIGKLESVENFEMVKTFPVRDDNGGEVMHIDGDGHKVPIAEAKDEKQKSVAENPESCRVNDGKPRNSAKRVQFLMDGTVEAESNAGRPDETPQMATSYFHGGMDDTMLSVITRTAGQSWVATSNRYGNVPDYVKNPSKYIHYVLDRSDEDAEKANVAAFHAARAVSSSTQDMVTDKQEEALLKSKAPSGATKINFNPPVSLSNSKELGKGMGPDASNGALIKGVVNIAANFYLDDNLGGIITMEDDQDLGASSAHEKSGRVFRRYRNRMAGDIETE